MNQQDIEARITAQPLDRSDFYTANSLMKRLQIVPGWQFRDMTNQALVALAKRKDSYPNREHILDWFEGPGKLYR